MIGSLTAAYTATQLAAGDVPQLGQRYYDPATNKEYVFLQNAGATAIGASQCAKVNDSSAFKVEISDTLSGYDFAGVRPVGATDLDQNECGWFQVKGNATFIHGSSAAAIVAATGIVLDDDSGHVGGVDVTTGTPVTQALVDASLKSAAAVFAVADSAETAADGATTVEADIVRCIF